MSAKPKTSLDAGKDAADGGDGAAPAGLRDRGAEKPAEGGARRGRPPGSKTMHRAGSPAPAVVSPQKTPDFIYTKVGKAFRAVFNIMAVKTDCNVWILAPDEEKDLGESFGDLLLDIGMVDSTITKCAFAAGTLVAVGGSKAIVYSAYAAQRAASRKEPAASHAPAIAGPKTVIEEKATDASVIPETAPGVI